MSHFCLPPLPKPWRADLKVDKKRRKCLIFVYPASKIGSRGLEVEQNPEKFRKYSTRLSSPKQRGLRLRVDFKKQRFARSQS